MTRLLLFSLMLASMLFCTSCIMESSTEKQHKQIAETAAKYNTTEENAQKIISLGNYFPDLNNMVYFRDPNTGACFVYIVQKFDSGTNYVWGGPGLAAVNCELAEKALINPAPPPNPPPETSCEQKSKELEDNKPAPEPTIPELLKP